MSFDAVKHEFLRVMSFPRESTLIWKRKLVLTATSSLDAGDQSGIFRIFPWVSDVTVLLLQQGWKHLEENTSYPNGFCHFYQNSFIYLVCFKEESRSRFQRDWRVSLCANCSHVFYIEVPFGPFNMESCELSLRQLEMKISGQDMSATFLMQNSCKESKYVSNKKPSV